MNEYRIDCWRGQERQRGHANVRFWIDSRNIVFAVARGLVLGLREFWGLTRKLPTRFTVTREVA